MKRQNDVAAKRAPIAKLAWLPALFCLCVFGPSPAGIKAAETSIPPLLAADIMNAFSARDLTGASWCSERLRNRVTVIHFWATWCPPCRKEIEHLRNVYHDHRNRDLDIIGINLEVIQRAELNRFLASHRVDWPQINEPGAFQSRLARLFQVTRLPGVFLIDRQGAIRQLHTSDRRAFIAAIETALGPGGYQSDSMP
ncbi:MAG TPA: TlpA disulfide reductase family protein [Acidobacteriota bacterium]|nr:TlpA disulfide reductase family protein [Acidobacteriota bacterium]